jgi:hypothetical protein
VTDRAPWPGEPPVDPAVQVHPLRQRIAVYELVEREIDGGPFAVFWAVALGFVGALIFSLNGVGSIFSWIAFTASFWSLSFLLMAVPQIVARIAQGRARRDAGLAARLDELGLDEQYEVPFGPSWVSAGGVMTFPRLTPSAPMWAKVLRALWLLSGIAAAVCAIVFIVVAGASQAA